MQIFSFEQKYIFVNIKYFLLHIKIFFIECKYSFLIIKHFSLNTNTYCIQIYFIEYKRIFLNVKHFLMNINIISLNTKIHFCYKQATIVDQFVFAPTAYKATKTTKSQKLGPQQLNLSLQQVVFHQGPSRGVP